VKCLEARNYKAVIRRLCIVRAPPNKLPPKLGPQVALRVVSAKQLLAVIGFGVNAGDVDGIALCRMFNTAISSKGVPKYLSSDNDQLFLYHQWQANLRILGADEVKTVPYTPLWRLMH
jgi:hypothetical protein